MDSHDSQLKQKFLTFVTFKLFNVTRPQLRLDTRLSVYFNKLTSVFLCSNLLFLLKLECAAIFRLFPLCYVICSSDVS